ncbi:MAG: hypothetical protein GYB65_15325 [Chloroflexi bacterium]|nr:hypothetical protein [Chloroflexota bacterium]
MLASLVALVGAPLLNSSRSVHAAEGVIIDSQTVSCDSITVTYTVFAAAELDYGLIYAHRADGTEIGLATGPGTTGQHTVTVSFPAEPAGTSLYARVSIGSGDGGRVEAQGAPSPCGGDGGGDDDDDDVPPDETDSPGAPPAWAGYGDGRLNPNPGEYYSVWCNFDRIDVYRDVPQVGLIKMIPLGDVIALPVGSQMDLGDYMVLERGGEDAITIYGSNGNGAPESGSKSFSLADCITSNGGAPEPSPPVDTSDLSPTEELREEDPQARVQEDIQDCQALYSDDQELLVDCLAYVMVQEGASSLEILWVWVFQLCLGLPVAVVLGPLALGIVRRRRQRREGDVRD